MKRDNSTAAVLLVHRGGNVYVAVFSNGQMPYGAQVFRHDAGVKTRRKDQAIRLLGQSQGDRRNEKKDSRTRSHRKPPQTAAPRGVSIAAGNRTYCTAMSCILIVEWSPVPTARPRLGRNRRGKQEL